MPRKIQPFETAAEKYSFNDEMKRHLQRAHRYSFALAASTKTSCQNASTHVQTVTHSVSKRVTVR